MWVRGRYRGLGVRQNWDIGMHDINFPKNQFKKICLKHFFKRRKQVE